MRADASGFRNSLIQEIFWTRTGLLLLILLVVSGSCLGLSSTMGDGLLKNFVLSVGTGTLITAVVSFGQTLLTANASQRALINPIVEQNAVAMRALVDEMRALSADYAPTHVFEASNRPDPSLNRVLMADLQTSREYFFRGFSGRHAAARLLVSHAERDLRVMIADPRCHGAINGRARYLLRRSDKGGDYDTIEAQLREEIDIGLVGLYLARSRCTQISLTVVADPPLNRLELFDSGMWLSLFTDPGGAGMTYPKTLRFSEHAVLYSSERAEFLRACTSRGAQHHVLQPDTGRPEFLRLYAKITGTTLTDDQLRALETKFHTFQREFTAAAELRS